MNLEMGFLHYLLMALGAVVGANLGLRGQAVFSFILLMIAMLILAPTYIGSCIHEHFAHRPKAAIPVAVPIGFVIILILIVFRMLGEVLMTFLGPGELSPIEDRIFGLALGAALGFFAAAFLF